MAKSRPTARDTRTGSAYVPPGRVDDHGGRVGGAWVQQKIAGYDAQIASLGAQIEAERTRAERIEESVMHSRRKLMWKRWRRDSCGIRE